MNLIGSLVHYALALLLAPLLTGVIARTKAWFGGRRGPPLLQAYYDLARLMRKGAVYSRTTTWVFRAGPVGNLAAVVSALTLVPFAGRAALVSFPCDLFAVAGLLALSRFVTVLAALDTGSAFEGMGASREVQFSALAEPGLLLALAAVARGVSASSLSNTLIAITPAIWSASGAVLLLACAALAIILLAENCRIPFDDPQTHLELTMIHEVMVLDHSGPDFALITYGAALKLWLFGALLTGLAVPVRTGSLALDTAAALAGMLAVGVGVGVVESTMARLRLLRVPQLLLSAAVCAMLAVFLQMR